MEAGPKAAPVIVALHGVGDNAMQWRFQFAGLADRFRFIAWNAPGYMLSDGFKADTPGCRDYADALADFLNALKLTRVHLMGNSFGSVVAQCFALYHPQRVDRVMLISPVVYRDRAESEMEAMMAGRRVQVAGGGYNFPSRRVRDLMGGNAPPELVELVSYAMRATNPRGFLQAVRFVLLSAPPVSELTSRMIGPVLVVAGGEDKVSPAEWHAEPLRKALRQCRVVVLSGIGHLAQMEAPEELNRLTREFFGK